MPAEPGCPYLRGAPVVGMVYAVAEVVRYFGVVPEILPRFRRFQEQAEDERRVAKAILEAGEHPDANGRVYRSSADGHNRDRRRGLPLICKGILRDRTRNRPRGRAPAQRGSRPASLVALHADLVMLARLGQALSRTREVVPLAA